MKPVKTPPENSLSENEPIKEEIKFHNEAHRKNYEKVMKLRSERKQKPEFETILEQIRKNSKD